MKLRKDTHLKTDFALIIIKTINPSTSVHKMTLNVASWPFVMVKTTRIQNNEDTLEQSIRVDGNL